MKPRIILLFLATLLVFAQTARDDYRNAYRAWRLADPTLERDAAIAGPALGADADRVANEAAKYWAQRGSFLAQSGVEQGTKLAWLEQVPAEFTVANDGAAGILTAASAAVQRSIATFSKDPDRGIQRLRAALERENTALDSLLNSVSDEAKAADTLRPASAAAEQARLVALTASLGLLTGLRQSVEESGREATAWANYYRSLSDAARSGVTIAVEAIPAPSAPPERRPSITPLPLARYTGAWIFPVTDGLFHGPQPEVVDMEVREENGRASGTLAGRFKVAGGDPVLRLTFSGEFQNTRKQVFALETDDGSKGTLELIPGPAFNLLEVDFKAEAKSGKIGQANFLLVKK